MPKETYEYVKRDKLELWVVVPRAVTRRVTVNTSKETYEYVKRDLQICKKKPMNMSQKTHLSCESVCFVL